ncbi:MAG: hypothetical protein RSB04_12120, partial [Gordonibacter sp.]|uniref:hypothetical protein n=1 Tax=Gordonibacter sp. TaxID=1968902 RepID=UPI002FCAAAEE
GAEWNEAGRGVLNAGDWVAQGQHVYGPFTRGASAYGVTCWGKAWGETVNGYGAWAGSAEIYANVTVPARPVYAPPAVTGVSNTRQDDNRNVVNWTNHSDVTHPYDSIKVERAVDDGSWSQIVSLAGSSTSYTDTSTSANHSYAYRVRTQNGAGYSVYATSSTTYNTPAAPTSIEASRLAETTVALAIANPALTATALELQRSTDAQTWVAVKSIAGSAVAEAQDTPGGGTFYYRARNTRGALASSWSAASNKVVTIVAPAAPTLVAPASGITLPKTQSTVTFSWQHNPIDGSAQTAAQLQHSTNGGTTWTTVQVTGRAQQTSVSSSWTVNSTVTWRVCTKGAHANYGAWSAAQAFKVCQVPTVAISKPATDSTILDDVPVLITWTYADASGTQQRATLSIADSRGKELWSTTLQGTGNTVSISSSELLPENNASFRIALTAYSTSGLAASAARTFSTDYEEPSAPGLQIEANRVLGSVSATIFEGAATAGVPRTVALGLFRMRADGSLLCLADKVPSGTGIADLYPPLDQNLSYVAVAYTANGLTARTEQTVQVASKGAVFINFGSNGYADVAKVAMDLEWSTSIETDSEVIETAGSEDPLVFFGSAKATESSVSGAVWRNAAPTSEKWGDAACRADAFERLAADVGIKIARYPHGPVVPSHIACKMSTSAANALVANIELTARKVKADELAI